MLKSILSKIGLDDKETSVYMTLSEKGRLTAKQISRITGINRTTVYSVCESLLSGGLVQQNLAHKTTQYEVVKDDGLNMLVDIEEKKFKEKKELIKELGKELSLSEEVNTRGRPRIRFIEQNQLDEFLKTRSNVWAESGAKYDKIWWGFQDHTVLEEYPSWPEYFWGHFAKDYQLRLFTNKQEIETEYMKGKTYKDSRIIRFWSGTDDFTTTEVVMGDFIVMIMTREEPHYLIEIEDKMMAHNLRELFKGMWRELKF